MHLYGYEKHTFVIRQVHVPDTQWKSVTEEVLMEDDESKERFGPILSHAGE